MRSFLRFPKWLLALVIVLIVARLALPFVVKSYVNKTLDSLSDYSGHVDDIGIALWRGSYQLIGLNLHKRDGVLSEPFLAVESIDIAIDWRALLKRRIVTSIEIIHPVLQFVADTDKKLNQTSIDESWQDKVMALVPFDINRLLITTGRIRFVDKKSKPKIDLFVQNLNAAAENITNAVANKSTLPSTVDLSGEVLHSGQTNVHARMNMLVKPFEADVKGTIHGLHLKELNEFTNAYGNFDFKEGDLDVAAEVAATHTRYQGYVKTLAKNVRVLDWSKERREGKSVPHLLWEGLVGALMKVFKNHDKNEFGARIPIAGNRQDLKIDKWATVGSILRNTFVKALTPDVEHSVRFSDVAKGKPAAKDGTTTSGSTTSSH